jgi:hypothetical protein
MQLSRLVAQRVAHWLDLQQTTAHTTLDQKSAKQLGDELQQTTAPYNLT